MEKFYYLFCILFLISWSPTNSKKENLSKKVIISGKINNFNPNNRDITLAINRPGLHQLEVNTQIDSQGHFKATFETYTTTDVWVSYETNFLIVIHPGDNINIEFDGNLQDRTKILKTIKFYGDSVKTNEDVAKFQALYYSNGFYKSNEKAIKEYNENEYINHLDTLKQKNNELYDLFISKTKPMMRLKFGQKPILIKSIMMLYLFTLTNIGHQTI
jgi:hypothetical protein